MDIVINFNPNSGHSFTNNTFFNLGETSARRAYVDLMGKYSRQDYHMFFPLKYVN